MEFRVLGPLEVVAEGRAIAVPGARERTLLAALLVARNTVVSPERLIEDLWEGDVPAGALNSLRVYASRLRKALRGGGNEDPVVTRSSGYLLEAPDDAVDAGRFEALVQRARSLAASGDAAAAASSVREGLALWRGPAYGDFADAPFARAEAARLQEARLVGLELRLECDLAGGHHVDVVGELEALCADHPLRERFWALRMLALYRSDRQAEALRAYQQLRRVLGEELGIEPSGELRRLEEAILLQRPDLDLPARTATTTADAAASTASLSAGRPLTLLLTDVEGSTALWENARQSMGAVMARHDAIVEAVVSAHRGVVVRPRGEGDSTFSVFGRASQAVSAAVELQRTLAAERWPGGVRLKVRAALHTGEVDERDGEFYGPTPNRAARLRSVAHGGQVLVSQATAEVARDNLPEGVALIDLGAHRLKDLAHPERIHQLVHPDLRSAFPPLRTLDALPHNLPAELTSFVGRDEELARVAALLDQSRLVTLTGTGGSGKTRLAQRVALELLESFADGVWFVELAPLAEPDSVVEAVATALATNATPGRSLLDAAVDQARSRRLLLVLDNCEHVLDAAAAVTTALLTGTDHVRVLATSRERLAIGGEATWPVPPLDVPEVAGETAPEKLLEVDSVRLFVDRATAAAPRFVFGPANAIAVAEICQRLDGIPLALELAAARVRLLAPEQIASRLTDRFRLLTGGDRTALPRQQTLLALVDWSHDLLDEAERRLLRRLSVFRGGFGIEAAEAVCADGDLAVGAVFDLLAQLVDKSLVLVDDDAGSPRFHLLETIREYAEQRAAAEGELTWLHERHLAWCVALVADASVLIGGHRQGEGLAVIDRDRDNLRSALESAIHGRRSEAVELVASLWPYWYIRGNWTESRGLLEAALALELPGNDSTRASALAGAAMFAIYQGDRVAGAARADEAIALARSAGNQRALALALGFRSQADSPDVGDELAPSPPDEVTLGRYREAVAVAERAGDAQAAGLARMWLAVARAPRGVPPHHPENSVTLYRQALADARRAGDRWLAGVVLRALAFFAQDDTEARAMAEEALAIATEVGDPQGVASLQLRLAGYAASGGALDEARLALELATASFRRLGRPVMVRDGLVLQAVAARLAGDFAGMLRLLDEAADLPTADSALVAVARAWNLAEVDLEGGKADDALRCIAARQSQLLLSEFEETEFRLIPVVAVAVAASAVRLGDVARGLRLFGKVWEGAQGAARIQPLFKPDVERHRRQVEEAVEDDAFQRESAAGVALTDAEAWALAGAIFEDHR